MQSHIPMISAPTGSRIRAYHSDELIADSRSALIFRESPFKISYAFPEKDVNMAYLEKTDKEVESPSKGRMIFYNLITPGSGEVQTQRAAFAYPDLNDDTSDLRGYIILKWNAMDSWYEEDEQILGHPRDPFTRIDVRKSSAHVVVTFNDAVIADSVQPRILMETGLPIRYYIPEEDVNWKYLVPIDKTTVCPYKGESRYWSIRVGDQETAETAWAYPDPLQDADRVQNMLCFYQEKLKVYVDDQLQEHAPTYFTK